MLAKQYRLSRKDFLLVKKSGTKVSIPNAKLIYSPNTLPHSRFSVVVSKQYSKSAVARNHFRREIYSLLTSHYSPPIDIIIYPFNEKIIPGLNQALLGLTARQS
ncbi:MAG: ribonuclease P protein component [Patescibacteria group bacterium]